MDGSNEDNHNKVDWIAIGKRWETSVLQIVCYQAIYNISRPYKSPQDRRVRGTGFIVDIERGLVVTNHHVAENAISMTGRSPKTGKYELEMTVIGICPERDLAICRIKGQDLLKITEKMSDPLKLNMIIGDNMDLSQAEEVLAIGYPLGEEHVKLTTGVISGFPDLHHQEKNKLEDHPSYIQMSAPINPGNSGGPLLNRKGEVIGINAAGHLFSQNVGYAIPSRVLMAIYDQLILDSRVDLPAISITWNRTNDELLMMKTGTSKISGIYIREVGDDSSFNALEEGDIISSITYEDPFYVHRMDNNDNCKICYQPPTKAEISSTLEDQELSTICKCPRVEITGIFDNYGEIKLYVMDFDYTQKLTNNMTYTNMTSLNETEDLKWPDPITDRRLSIKEFFDMIPIHTKLYMKVCRNRQWYRLNSVYSPISDIYVISKLELKLQPIEYDIFCGMCISPLTINYLLSSDVVDNDLQSYAKGKKKYKPYLVVTQVFPNTSISKANAVEAGDIIKMINGRRVRTMEDLRSAVLEKNEMISITTTKRSFFVCNRECVIKQDLFTMKNFSITNYTHLLDDGSYKIDETY